MKVDNIYIELTDRRENEQRNSKKIFAEGTWGGGGFAELLKKLVY